MFFQKALPVWAENLEQEMNITTVFYAEVPKGQNVILSLACSSSFTAFVNGEFVGFGPARAAKGYYRVEEIELTPFLTEQNNQVEIRVAGYYVNGFYLLDTPPFLCAEILADNTVIAYTGGSGFDAYIARERIQKIQRYSFMRPFAEAYDYTRRPEAVRTVPVEEKRFLPRNILPYEYPRVYAKQVLSKGNFTTTERESYRSDRAIDNIGPQLKGFAKDEYELFTFELGQKLDFTMTEKAAEPADTVVIGDNSFATIAMEKNYSGLLGMEVECKEDTFVYVLFDEILSGEDIDFLRMDCSNILTYKLPKGKYRLLTAEPYTMKYLRIAAEKEITVKNIHIIKIGYPESTIKAKFEHQNPRLKAIYDAALETFCANAADIFMDCPSRERGGYLCDSFFTARVEQCLTGTSLVEHNFLENFIMGENFECLPEGMLPMCYPAEHYDGLYIPNWAMWFTVQLVEYQARSGDNELIQRAKEKLYGLLTYFKQYENEYGLLEDLDSWVFVEWSHANDLTGGVNFPTNMLYANFKKALYTLYGDEKALEEAQMLKNTILELSPCGDFFCDNAMRNQDGKLELSGECTEVCQYYAFFFDIASPESHERLWKILLYDFGPNRKQTKAYPEIAFANAFIGNYLRLDLLHRYGYGDLLLENIDGYFYQMAEKTGTLWEHDSTTASCCHGFASHVIYWFDKLGLVSNADLQK